MKRIVTWLFEEHGGPNLHRNFPKAETPSPRNVVAREDEKRMLLAAAPPHVRCWLLMCSDLAIRSGTAAALCPRNYDPTAKTLTFTTKKARAMTLPVTAELAHLLDAVSGGDANTPFVCLLHPNGTIGAQMLRAWINRNREKAGITRRITAHDFRRATAVSVYSQTRDLRIVQAVLGHRHLSATLHYLDHRNTPVDPTTLELAKLPPATKGVQ